MRQNTLYLIIGVLLVVSVGGGLYLWQQSQKPAGVELRVDGNGISVQRN
jgi:hypothetical protein